MQPKLYGDRYPSSTEYLLDEKVIFPPKHIDRSDLKWSDGLDIEIPFRNMSPARFEKYRDQILLMAYEELHRYEEVQWKFGSFEVKISRKGKTKEIPDIASFQAAMSSKSDLLVYGEDILGYEVPQKHYLNNKQDDVIEIARRYGDKVDQQNPYRVLKLVLSVRQPRFEYTPAGGYRGGKESLPGWKDIEERYQKRLKDREEQKRLEEKEGKKKDED